MKSVRQLNLCDALPDFAVELLALLESNGYPNLATQVQSLKIIDRCSCPDSECGTFYAASRPSGSWDAGRRDIRLPVQNYDLILDVVDENVVCVEVLGRPDLRLLVVQALAPVTSG